MMPLQRRVVAVAVCLLLTGCQGVTLEPASPSPGPPEIVIPPGAVSARSADQVARMTLDDIAAAEWRLGHALAPARIVRIQLLRPGDVYPGDRLDGTNPQGQAFGTMGDPAWVVEVIGTFYSGDRTDRIAAKGTHGFSQFFDSGNKVVIFYACWTLHPQPLGSWYAPDNFEGTCE